MSTNLNPTKIQGKDFSGIMFSIHLGLSGLKDNLGYKKEMYSTAQKQCKAKCEGQKGSLEAKKSKSWQFSVGKEGIECYIKRDMLAIRGVGGNKQEKICKCYWKTKGSSPEKILKSHPSNVRLGPLLQLPGFPQQEKEASLSLSAQIWLETPPHNPEGSHGQWRKATDETIICNLTFPPAFSFGLFDYG